MEMGSLVEAGTQLGGIHPHNLGHAAEKEILEEEKRRSGGRKEEENLIWILYPV
jgi:hypothetical protein